MPGDQETPQALKVEADDISANGGPPMKKRKKEQGSKISSPSLKVMQGHFFQLLRPMLSTHTDIRDALARCRVGDIEAFEHVLSMIEDAIKIGLQEYEAEITEEQARLKVGLGDGQEPSGDAVNPSEEIIAKYKRPWWICQPHIRLLPEEALKIGALKLSKKELAKAEVENEAGNKVVMKDDSVAERYDSRASEMRPELPRPALVCG